MMIHTGPFNLGYSMVLGFKNRSESIQVFIPGIPATRWAQGCFPYGSGWSSQGDEAPMLPAGAGRAGQERLDLMMLGLFSNLHPSMRWPGLGVRPQLGLLRRWRGEGDGEGARRAPAAQSTASRRCAPQFFPLALLLVKVVSLKLLKGQKREENISDIL